MNENNVILISDLAPVFGLAATASKDIVLAKLAVLSLVGGLVTIQDNKITTLGACEIKDGKLALPDIAGLAARLQKIEEAGTKGIATLSASINGVMKTFSAEDLVKVLDRVNTLETKFTTSENTMQEAERGKIIKLFSAEGKVPKKSDGTAYSTDELKKLDTGILSLLHANTPSSVPLHARNQTGMTDGVQKKYRDDKGNVDLAAVFEDESRRAGLTYSPNI